MAQPETVHITRITETIGRLEAGKLTAMMRIEFTVGDYGPFSKEFARATFDPLAARAELDYFAQQLRQLSQGR